MGKNVIVKVGASNTSPALYANGDGTLVLCPLAIIPGINNGAVYFYTIDGKGKLCINGAWQSIATENNVVLQANTTISSVVSLNYVDNAAAIAAGLTAGRIYHTNGTLKIVI